jgi:hypothetical protein
VDAVGPHVHVVHSRQIAGVEGSGVVLPLHRQPGDRRGGQARVGAQEPLQRWDEILAGQAMQVQQRQHLGDLRGLAAPCRQDHRGEPAPLPGALVDAFVIDPRRADLDRAGRGQHPPRRRVAVAHHQATAVLVELPGVRVDIRGDLGLQRRREHPPRTVTHDLVDQRRARRRGRWRHIGVGNYREHGRTLPTRVGARALLDSWTWTRREGIPPDLHPQVSSIEPFSSCVAVCFDAVQNEDGLHDRGGSAWAAAQLDQDLPGFEGGDGSFAAGADFRVGAVDGLLPA